LLSFPAVSTEDTSKVDVLTLEFKSYSPCNLVLGSTYFFSSTSLNPCLTEENTFLTAEVAKLAVVLAADFEADDVDDAILLAVCFAIVAVALPTFLADEKIFELALNKSLLILDLVGLLDGLLGLPKIGIFIYYL
jgi:hypothetical protein